MKMPNVIGIPLLVVLSASLAACVASADSANDTNDTNDTNDDPAENVAEVSSEIFHGPCLAPYHCIVQCQKPDGSLGAAYDRGPHNDCYGDAVAFCSNKWGYSVHNNWCTLYPY